MIFIRKKARSKCTITHDQIQVLTLSPETVLKEALCPGLALRSGNDSHQPLWLSWLPNSPKKYPGSSRRPKRSSPWPGLDHIPSSQPGIFPAREGVGKGAYSTPPGAGVLGQPYQPHRPKKEESPGGQNHRCPLYFNAVYFF